MIIEILKLMAENDKTGILAMKNVNEFEKYLNEGIKRIHKEWNQYDEATCWMKKQFFCENLCLMMANNLIKIKNKIQDEIYKA